MHKRASRLHESCRQVCASIRIADTRAVVRADRKMLRGVLLNLLLNAGQSGSSDPIEVIESEHAGTCHIDITDRGTGFGDTNSERLFEAFHPTKKSGTGLGWRS